MILKPDSNIQNKYPRFQTKAIILNDVQPHAFDFSNDKKKIIRNRFETSMDASKQMSEFYKVQGAKRKCHVESLLNAFDKEERFKSINYIVDLVYYLELATGLLMGVHDLNCLHEFIEPFVIEGGESFHHISGRTISPQMGSICFKDNNGIFASLTEGPDDATKVTSRTKDAIILFFIPPNINENIIKEFFQFISDTLTYENLSFKIC